MTRTHHDLFAKQHLEALLETVGDVKSSRKIVSETHEVDILFVLQISLNVGQNLSTDERALAMNLTPVYEKWRQDTLDEGRQEGRQEGLEQEARSLILRQLTRRVGILPSSIRLQVESLPLFQLESLGEALLDFTSADDLGAWLRTLGA